jgi:uncharacterized membrane protein YfcA
MEKELQVEEIKSHSSLVPSGWAKANRGNARLSSGPDSDQVCRMPWVTSEILTIALVFLLAGFVKGVAGMGLPTVAMGLLGLAAAPAQAAALVVVPSLVTNVWQFLSGQNWIVVARRIWPMLVAIGLTTWASAGLMTSHGEVRAVTWLGVALVFYTVIGLAKIRISIPKKHEGWLSPVMGVATGIVTGATGVFVIPSVPYLQALGLGKDDLVQALGLSFTMSTLALAAGLASRGAFQMSQAGGSTLCIAPALIGMAIGQVIRAKVNPAAFHLVFFACLLLLGGDLIARSILWPR